MLSISDKEIECSIRSESVTTRTHCHTLLIMFLATNKMGDIWGDIIREGASVDLDPFSDLIVRALFSEGASDRNGESFE